MNTRIKERLAALRAAMAKESLAACYIPTADYHLSEYVGEHFKFRAWLSGFTGSAGTLVVLPDQAGLWTDGRYFLQAEAQLAGTGIDLYKMQIPGVPTIEEFLTKHLKPGDRGRAQTAEPSPPQPEKLLQMRWRRRVFPWILPQTRRQKSGRTAPPLHRRRSGSMTNPSPAAPQKTNLQTSGRKWPRRERTSM